MGHSEFVTLWEIEAQKVSDIVGILDNLLLALPFTLSWDFLFLLDSHWDNFDFRDFLDFYFNFWFNFFLDNWLDLDFCFFSLSLNFFLFLFFFCVNFLRSSIRASLSHELLGISESLMNEVAKSRHVLSLSIEFKWVLLILDNSKDLNWSLLQCLDFQEGMRMIDRRLTIWAEIEVWAHRAFVPYSNDRFFSASIACDSGVDDLGKWRFFLILFGFCFLWDVWVV